MTCVRWALPLLGVLSLTTACDDGDPEPVDIEALQEEGAIVYLDDLTTEPEAAGDDAEDATAPADDAADGFTAEPDTAEASWYCGNFCPLFTVPVGVGCSTGCPGTCPNMVACEFFVPNPEAEITGTPSVVEVSPGTLGTTQVCWDTQGLNYPVWIRVRVNGGPGQLFTKESDNGSECEQAPWIQAGNSYEFSIRDDNNDFSQVYASTTITGVQGPDTSTGGDDGGDSGDSGDFGCGDCPGNWTCHCFDQCRPPGSICP